MCSACGQSIRGLSTGCLCMAVCTKGVLFCVHIFGQHVHWDVTSPTGCLQCYDALSGQQQ